jgi:hypothetical protein
MKNQNYSICFAVDQSPEQVFNAINNVRGWWSGEIEVRNRQARRRIYVPLSKYARSKRRITELVPNKKVVWHVLDSSLSFLKDRSEWTGTDIVFDVLAKDGKTEVRFTHVGLAPQIECYGSCSNAWGMLVNGNLRKLITTGKAQPDTFA